MVDDYIRISNKNITLQDCFDKEVATLVATTVLTHYSRHIQRSGFLVQVDHWLFIWNGGGGAWRRVHAPKKDKKQFNLERYRTRALRIIDIYEKKKT